MHRLALPYILSIILGLTSLSSKGQLQVADSMSLNNLVQSLVGNGVTVTNVTSNGGRIGEFSNGNSSIGISDGLIMSSGSIYNALGPNNQSGAGESFGGNGDADLANQIGVSVFDTYDAAVIEFDLIPNSDLLSFNYVFASEEYPEYTCSNFNDAFAFLVSGPGIVGQKNIALIPGTGIPVSINNVNNGDPGNFTCFPSNPQHFVANYAPNGSFNNNKNIQYDGFTRVLQAQIIVQPCQTYHFKLVVADLGDGILDSGVFIERGSLKSFETQVLPASFYERFDYGIEGCNNGGFIFSRDFALSDPLVVKYVLKGSADNGTDYELVADSLVIPPFVEKDTLVIKPLLDTVSDPVENVVIYLFDLCTNQPDLSDSATLIIREKFLYEEAPDTAICRGDTVLLNTAYNLNVDLFQWSPSSILTCTTCVTPSAFPDTTSEVYVNLVDTVGGCEGHDTILIEVYDYPTATWNLTSDSLNTICLDDTNQLQVTGSVNIGSVSYQWRLDSELIVIDDSTGNVLPDTSKYFYMTLINDLGCEILDSHLINVSRRAYFDIIDPPTLCFNSGTIVGPDVPPIGSYIYQWTPTTGVTDPDSATTFINPGGSGQSTYYLTAFSAENFCDYTTEVNFDLDPQLQVDADVICLDMIAPLDVEFIDKTIAGHQYLWEFMTSDSTVIGTSTDPSPVYTFNDPGDYLVKLHVIGADSSCQDSLYRNVSATEFEIYNVFTPNGDGINETFVIKGIKPGIGTLEVYNRWGERVFLSEEYRNDWDGQGVSEGTYYYFFKLDHRDLQYKGWVQIMR